MKAAEKVHRVTVKLVRRKMPHKKYNTKIKVKISIEIDRTCTHRVLTLSTPRKTCWDRQDWPTWRIEWRRISKWAKRRKQPPHIELKKRKKEKEGEK